MSQHEYIRLGEVGLVQRGLLADAPEPRPLFVARVEIAERRAREDRAIVSASERSQ